MKLTKHLLPFADKIKVKHDLAPYTWFKIGGPAEFFITVKGQDELVELVRAAYKDQLPVTILGGGSNVLISDKGIKGIVIRNKLQDIKFLDNHRVTAESGVIVNQLVNSTIQKSLEGLEEFLGIPGTVGGAVYNNSHHLKHLIGDYIHTVKVVTPKGQVKTLSYKEMDFAYDYSILQKTKDIVLEAQFQLKLGEKAQLLEKAQAALRRRRDTQPLEKPSSGCMFKNIGEKAAKEHATPEGATAAGYLVDKAGLKGLTVGGATVSNKHANFIVNTGNASAKDVIELSDLIKKKIKDRFGVTLEREVFIIGE